MKHITLLWIMLSTVFLLQGSAGATSMTFDFTDAAEGAFQGASRTFDLGEGVSVTATATWTSDNLGASGNGEVFLSAEGLGTLHTYTTNDDFQIDGAGPDDTLWLTFSQRVILSHLTFSQGHFTDQFDLFVGDTLILEDQETVPGWRPLGTNGYEGTVFGIRADMHDDEFYLTQIRYTPVPEPGSMALLGFGLLGAMGYSRKRCRD
ncbi:MAG: PEP-CTERM sorting domain-containing protein [Desulfobacterales bacterium]|nr:PEP-CTERM sorting domain-containing protein [Desulfobacterales bacterium]